MSDVSQLKYMTWLTNCKCGFETSCGSYAPPTPCSIIFMHKDAELCTALMHDHPQGR